MSVSSCSVTKSSRHVKSPVIDRQRDLIAAEARQYLGSPYKYGGNSKKGIDCSGLVHLVFIQAGIRLPRTSSQQFKTGKSISLEQVQHGDLLFFTQKGKINHVSIVTKVSRGSIWVVHSTTTKGVIREDILASSYWESRIRGARDVLNKY